jgi:hypothetical protein
MPSETIDREIKQYLADTAFCENLNLKTYNPSEIEAWLRSKIGVRYPTDYAPNELRTIRMLRGRYQAWLRRGGKPREDVSADPTATPLVNDLLKELAEEMDQPRRDKAWRVNGFTADDLKEAEEDLSELSDDELDILVQAIAHASRDFSSAVKALVTFELDGGRS